MTGDDNQTQQVINCNALPRLLALLNSPKKGIRKDSCFAISNIASGTREQIQAVTRELERSVPPMPPEGSDGQALAYALGMRCGAVVGRRS